MNPRKRSASQALLPTRTPKRRSNGPSKTAATQKDSSQGTSLFGRWVSVIDTFRSAVASMRPLQTQEPLFEFVQPPLPKVDTNSSTPSRFPRPAPSDPQIRSKVFDRTPPRIPSPPIPASSYTTSETPSNLPFPRFSADPFEPDPPRGPIRPRKRAVMGHAGVLKKPRQHIYANIHKARVKENMQRELYALQRARGYSQDFSTFRGWLMFRERLEAMDAFSPASTLGHHRSSSDGPIPPSPSSSFLERAIQKAKVSLAGPKPPKPFVPSLSKLRLEDRAKDEEIERRIRGKKQLPDTLPPEHLAQVEEFMAKTGLVGKAGKEQVTHNDIMRLKPAQWLNDEVINMYGAMIMERAERNVTSKENYQVNGVAKGVHGINGVEKNITVKPKPGPTYLQVHVFNTFFFAKLEESGYEKGRLNKWTKKVDIFKKDMVIIPVNLGNSHWTCAAINFKRKRFEYYDSMGMRRDKVYKLLRIYTEKEHQDKKKKPIDLSGWEDYFSLETPQQENGFDCGVFTCQFMETLSRGAEEFEFTQKDMPYLRLRMIWELGRSQLASP